MELVLNFDFVKNEWLGVVAVLILLLFELENVFLLLVFLIKFCFELWLVLELLYFLLFIVFGSPIFVFIFPNWNELFDLGKFGVFSILLFIGI